MASGLFYLGWVAVTEAVNGSRRGGSRLVEIDAIEAVRKLAAFGIDESDAAEMRGVGGDRRPVRQVLRGSDHILLIGKTADGEFKGVLSGREFCIHNERGTGRAEFVRADIDALTVDLRGPGSFDPEGGVGMAGVYEGGGGQKREIALGGVNELRRC